MLWACLGDLFGSFSQLRAIAFGAVAIIGAFSYCVSSKRNERARMAKNFYHGKDADIVTGSANFASSIVTAFATFGLTSAQSTAFGTLNTALQSSYTAGITPATRTPVTIEAKNTALVNMRRNAILLSKIIYATATVTDAQLVSLGLLPRTVPTPRPVPATPPVLEVVSCSGRL